MARRRRGRLSSFLLRAFFNWVIVATIMVVIGFNMHFQIGADGQMSPQNDSRLIGLLFAMVPATFALMFVVRLISRRREGK